MCAGMTRTKRYLQGLLLRRGVNPLSPYPLSLATSATTRILYYIASITALPLTGERVGGKHNLLLDANTTPSPSPPV